MGNKIKFMSSVDVPNIDVSNTTTTKILNAQDATINTASVFGLIVENEATIGTMRNTEGGVSLGGAKVGANIAIGNRADGKGASSIAIGNNAVANTENAIQFGAGINNTANSLQIGDNNIYDIENNEIRLYKSEYDKDIEDQTEEMRTADGGYKLQNEDKKYEWDWDIAVYIGKGLKITLTSASLNAAIERPSVFSSKYDEDTGYITFNCIGTTGTAQGFPYSVSYTYTQTIPASNTNITAGNIQTQNIQTQNISFLSQYDSETKTQQDLDTILQDIDLRLNTMKKYSFGPNSLEDVWNFLAKNDGVHGIYIRHSFDFYSYVSGVLFHTRTGTKDIYALRGVGWISEDSILLLGIDIIKDSDDNGVTYTVQGHTQSTQPYTIDDIQRIEIN